MSFRSCRQAAGLTQAQVADALDVSPVAVSQWETATTLPTAKRLSEIAALYACTVDELLREEEGGAAV